MRDGPRSLMVAVAMFVVTACAPVCAQAQYRVMRVENGGTVQGRVRMTSLPSEAVTDRVTKDKAVCGRRKPSPRLITGADNGVRYAVVWIDRISAGKKGRPSGIATLRQHNCEYSPHVLLLNPGDELEIVNEDPLLHNVHSYDMNAGLRSVFNIAQPVRGYHTHVRGSDIEGISAMMTTCDAGHPWMSAYVIRASSPYCAVTDADGNFTLGDVPPGTYTLKMWHEGIAARPSKGGAAMPPVVEGPYTDSREITVKAGETATVRFDLSLRPAVASN